MNARYVRTARLSLFWLIWAVTGFVFIWAFYSPYEVEFTWNGTSFPKAMLGPILMLVWSAIFLKSEPNYARAGLIVLAILLFAESLTTMRS